MKCKRVFALLTVIIAFAAQLHALDLPSPAGYVSDFASVISDEDEAVMREIIAMVLADYEAEIVVVTVETFSPYDSIDEYTIALARQWDVGGAYNDAGVVFLIALEERRVRIEVGYGLEGAITDQRAAQILDWEVIPALSDGHVSAGMLNGVIAISQAIFEYHSADDDQPTIGGWKSKGK